MRLLAIYTMLGLVLSGAADKLGAGMPVTVMAGLVGPPLLHFLWLWLRMNERF